MTTPSYPSNSQGRHDHPIPIALGEDFVQQRPESPWYCCPYCRDHRSVEGALPTMAEQAVGERRRFRRFDLKLPIELIRAGSQRLSRGGETWNLSSGGVLFKLHSQLELGDRIEYVITFPSSPDSDSDVQLVCRGKVVRLKRPKEDIATASGEPIAVAATLQRYEFIRHTYPQIAMARM